jgi:hypothetical protein
MQLWSLSDRRRPKSSELATIGAHDRGRGLWLARRSAVKAFALPFQPIVDRFEA